MTVPDLCGDWYMVCTWGFTSTGESETLEGKPGESLRKPVAHLWSTLESGLGRYRRRGGLVLVASA